MRNSLRAACLLGLRDRPDDSLSAARHDDAIRHQRLLQDGGEAVAGLVMIARQRLGDANRHDRASRQRQSCGRGSLIRLLWRLLLWKLLLWLAELPPTAFGRRA